MRSVRISRTFNEELKLLLSQGLPRFGAKVVAEKQALILNTIHDFLTHHPMRPADRVLGVCAYPITRTPFVLLYDYDDNELRVHLNIHGRADRTRIDLTKVVW